MSRTSSPGTYSRNSSKSIPRPLKWLRYAPTIMSFTSRLVRTSTRRTAARRSVRVMRENPSDLSLRHRHGIEDFANNVIGSHCLGFSLVGQDDAVTQNIGADAFHVLGCNVSAALEQRPGFGRHGQINRRSRRSAELDEMFYFDFVLLGLARGEDQMDD